MLPRQLNCPDCNTLLELNKEERISQQFTCPHCGHAIDLSERNDYGKPGQTDLAELITIYSPQDELEHQTVVSILENAGILCYSINSIAQNLFGSGPARIGYLVSGPVKIKIAAGDINNAVKVLNEQLYEEETENEKYTAPY